MTRVTPVTLSSGVMAGLQSSLARLQQTQEQLSSGRRLNRPSDSPVDTVVAMQLRAQQGQQEQLSRNIDDGLAWLNTADSALSQAGSSLTRVRQLVLAGSNATNGPAERQAMAAEVDQLRAGILQLANTQYAGRPVFAGTQDTASAFDPATGAYLGNGATVDRTVSDDAASGRVPVSVPGSNAFTTLLADPAGPAGAGVLDRISTALRSGDTTALGTALADLDSAGEALRSTQSTVGARTNRLTAAQSSGALRADTVTARLSAVEDIDLAKAITDLSLQQTAYQAALGAAAKVVQPSLMDFLR
ncbi:flagellar hook-associated protein FlgL [Nostocoides sp. HKS02]|uniref:flagellar hook-associated protein FlgL n=1 Tax=Nostocoides sp. HKS02 TaxID=1813880 RepID=UPI0012B4D1EC|nr:flagellar hook-associated protein FlgL [Tetrasphaera sp. HKS02]QGN58028.1 flagellar hook-associated protein 3 [Tetrasphaera sp. HKS02]